MSETELDAVVEEFKRALFAALSDTAAIRIHRTAVFDAGPLSVAIVVTRTEQMRRFESALKQLG